MRDVVDDIKEDVYKRQSLSHLSVVSYYKGNSRNYQTGACIQRKLVLLIKYE